MDLTLEQLLATLNPGLDKAAGDKCDDEYTPTKKEEDKKFPFAKDEDDKEKKEEGKAPSEKKKDMEKEASAQGADLAREVMEKVANLKIESVPGMKKTAAETAGKALADALLLKLAGVGDQTTSNGIDPAGTPSKIQEDNAALVAEDDSKIKPIATSDGNQATGSINEIFDAIVADAMSQGAASTDQVHTTGVASHEGAAEKAVPNQEKVAALNELIESGVSFEDATSMIKQAELEIAENLEKTAAVQALVEQGVDFDTAADLVKQAALDIAAEEEGLAKAAAVSELMAQGIDFDKAVEMVKEAGVGDVTTTNGIDPAGAPSKIQKDNAAMVAEADASIKPMQTSDGQRPQGSINEIFDAIVADAAGQGAASTDQVHDTGVAKAEGGAEKAVPNQIKTAALAKLMEAGMDFEKAAATVQAASVQAMEKSAGVMGDVAKQAAGMVKSTAGKAAAAFKGAAPSTKFAIGAAGGAAASSMLTGMKEKKAEAFNLLIEQGVDFDEATRLVKEASAKLGA